MGTKKRSLFIFVTVTILLIVFLPHGMAERCPVCGGESETCWTDETGVVYCKNTLICYPSKAEGKAYVIDTRCQAIGSSAFSGNNQLNSVIIPDGVVAIYSSAFAMTNLESVILPESLLIIDYGAFMNCHQLRTIDIPSSVYVIGDAAFVECPLSHINIPASVHWIGSEAFAKTDITDVYFENDRFYTVDTFVRNNERKQITFHFPIFCVDEECPSIERLLNLYDSLGTLYDVKYDMEQ